jgi:hypothetical protein
MSAGACGERDTGCVSMAALAAQVDAVVSRGHVLFGDPATAAETAFDAAGLAAARELVRAGQPGIAGLSGDLVTTYRGTALGDAAVTDAALVGQVQGYSPQQTIAILSCAMQESRLNPKAISPNGLWRNIFQQDSSYADRDNPNLAARLRPRTGSRSSGYNSVPANRRHRPSTAAVAANTSPRS